MAPLFPLDGMSGLALGQMGQQEDEVGEEAREGREAKEGREATLYSLVECVMQPLPIKLKCLHIWKVNNIMMQIPPKCSTHKLLGLDRVLHATTLPSSLVKNVEWLSHHGLNYGHI